MTEILKKEGNKVYFNLVIPYDELEEAQKQVYFRDKKKFSLPGFRKGHVPRKILEMNYGEDIFFEDAINLLIPDLYDKAVEEMDLKVAGRPNINLKDDYEKGKDLTLEIDVDVMPEIELGDYSKIELVKENLEVKDEMINSEIEKQRMNSGRLINVDRPSQNKDILNINYEGKVDGKVFEGGSAENQNLELGSNTFIPGFEDQLLDKKVGDHVEVKVKFPEEYHAKDLAGKDAVFDVDINSIQVAEYPEVDDEFAKDISEFDTLEELKQDIRRKLEEEFEKRSESQNKANALEKVSQITEFDIPEGLIESQIETDINNFFQRMQSQGLDMKNYMGWVKQNYDSMKEDFRPNATKTVRNNLLLEAIAKKENLEVSEDEINEEIEKMSKLYFPDKEEDAKKFAEEIKNGSTEFIEKSILDRKSLDKLMENVVYVEKKEEPKEESETENSEENSTEEKPEGEN